MVSTADGEIHPHRHLRVREVAAAVERWLEDEGYESYDPYDGLTSPLLAPLFGQRALARACLQLVKRSPLNLRPALGIRKRLYTQTLADLVKAALLFFKAEGEPRQHDNALQLAARLRKRALGGHPGACWGMDLPYVSRFAVATPTTPNLFQTVNAGNALLDVFDVAHDAEALTQASKIVEFLERGLGRLENTSESVVWRYYPGQDAVVYNVNALIAAFLARLAARTGRPEWATLARQTMRFVLDEQNADGSWYYSRDRLGRWIDGFHSGYVLESLLDYGSIIDDVRVREALGLGTRYFRRSLLDPDGTPRYSSTSRYPLDIQNCAQAVQLLSKLALQDEASLETAERAFERTLEHLLVRSGPDDRFRATFCLQRGRWWTNPLPAIRWGVAPMLVAMAWLWTAQVSRARSLSEKPEKPT